MSCLIEICKKIFASFSYVRECVAFAYFAEIKNTIHYWILDSEMPRIREECKTGS